METFFSIGYKAYWKGDRCPEGALPEEKADWQRGWNLALDEVLRHEFRPAD